MFNFLKSAADLEREFRDWVIFDHVRLLGNDKYSEWKKNIDDTDLVWLMECSAPSIISHFKDARFNLELTGVRMNADLDSHYRKGAKILHVLLKKHGWGVAASPDERMNGGTIIVDIATGKRVRD